MKVHGLRCMCLLMAHAFSTAFPSFSKSKAQFPPCLSLLCARREICVPIPRSEWHCTTRRATAGSSSRIRWAPPPAPVFFHRCQRCGASGQSFRLWQGARGLGRACTGHAPSGASLRMPSQSAPSCSLRMPLCRQSSLSFRVPVGDVCRCTISDGVHSAASRGDAIPHQRGRGRHQGLLRCAFAMLTSRPGPELLAPEKF